MKNITEFRIIDHGFDSPQYFQGCGIGSTNFRDVATGVGDSAREALNDALDSLKEDDWNVANVTAEGVPLSRETVAGYLRTMDIDGDGAETYAYVSILVK